MHSSPREKFLEALSFLPPELRTALVASPDGSTCDALPGREVALLWCDISGFSGHTDALLSSGADGVDKLHREIDAHYRRLIETILMHGGEPVTFVGDGLLSVWPVGSLGMSSAVAAASNTAWTLASLRKNGDTSFDLNQHISCGEIRTVELGGRHGRWLTTSVGSALKELESIADLKEPNEIFLTAGAADVCPAGSVSGPMGDHGACKLLACPPASEVDRTVLDVPPPEAWGAVVARMPRFAAGWIETVGLTFLAELRPVTSVSIVLPGFDQSVLGGAGRLNAVVQCIQDIVHRRDGYVAEVTVDDKGVSVLVTFGTPPDAHSDDPLRSVLSAGEIIAALTQRGVQSSIGVATGRMLCCIVGSADQRCSLVLGDAVIRSTRMASAVESGMLVDEKTMRATQDKIYYEAEPLMLRFKGAQAQSPAWAPQADQSQFAPKLNTAGRDEENEKLLRCWRNAASGIYGTNIVIEGDSGLGKTSLALNLRNTVEAGGGSFRLEAASALEQDAPFSALRHLVMDKLGVLPLMSTEARQTAILTNLPDHMREGAPFLNALFPTGFAETDFTIDLTGQARAAQIQNYVVDLLCHAFDGDPSCLCIDDAQWLDAESGRVLARLAEHTPNLMIVVLTQPTSETKWHDFAQSAGFGYLRLGALSRDGLHDLICLRLACTGVVDDLLDQIETRTEGHPFYTAEVLRSLVDGQAIVIEDGNVSLSRPDALSASVLPDTLHGMVLQRLDRLEPAAQLSLRVASVAGLAFPTKLVCDIHPLKNSAEDVSLQLDQQVVNGFLRPRSLSDLPGFAFSHGIVRDVAHSQMPKRQSRGLHAKAAEWIEGHAGDDRASRLLEIAHHWTEAGVQTRAVACLLEEALRLFSQGFAVDAVHVGLRAIAAAGVKVPDGPEVLQREIEQNIAEIERLTAGRHPTELLADMKAPPDDLALRFQAILSTAPFAFQSNQFEMFAWASTVAMRLVMENNAGPPHAFSMYSIVRSLLTGDRAAGAAWSRAALDLDAATGGGALPAAGFIDTWFHGHWRGLLQESAEINHVAAARALADDDQQYASYNIAGGIILKAALGHALEDVIADGAKALMHPLHRNARMHVHLEMQFARALRSQTQSALSLSDHDLDETREIGWVAETEFANQTGFYFATRVRLHRFAGDWDGALNWYERVAPLRAAIAGQLAEVDLILHVLLARFGQILSDRTALHGQRNAIEGELAQLAQWGTIQKENFAAKAEIARLVWSGIVGDAQAVGRLAELADTLGPKSGLQDRALAFEYAARLQPTPERVQDAINAYEEWGATGVAQRLKDKGLQPVQATTP